MKSKEFNKLLKKVAQKINITETGCWNYTGKNNGKGYGLIGFDGKRHTASHTMLVLSLGRHLKKGLEACHRCPGGPNRLCINPSHITEGTRSDNVKDSVKDGTHNQSRKTQCPRGHNYTHTYVRPDGRKERRCKVCADAYAAAKQAALKGHK